MCIIITHKGGNAMNQTINNNIDFARAIAVLWGSIEKEKQECQSQYEDLFEQKEKESNDPIHSICSTNY